jgi:hypothetical protein
MTLVEEPVAAAITGDEATRIATSLTTHVQATMPATGLTRIVAKRLQKQPTATATATASPPTLLGFAIYSLRNSSLSGSPSTTRSKTQFSGLGATHYPLKTLVATTT